jgi:prepilin-type N-terminal cleavage/methylation domain-containing protein
MGNMKMRKQNTTRGFTLLELMISMAVGLIAMAAMAMLFKTGMNSTMLVTQRIDTQENMRVGVDLMIKDISLAGAGLPTGGLQLPYGAGSSLSKFGCDQTGTCHVPSHTYPTGPSYSNYMYGIIPGYQNGVENNAVIAAAPSPAFSDSITVVYADSNPLYPLNQYVVSFVAGTSGGQVNLAQPVGGSLPSIKSNGFLNEGDVIMIQGGSSYAVGEITNLSASSSSPGATGSITFANSDPLNINQSGAAQGNLLALANVGGTYTATRLYVVTYYLTVPTVAGQTPRLMRQVNGLTPAPVADDIINLQFAFDNYNSSTEVLDANQANPLGVGESPNNIQKVNLLIMGQSIINNQKNSQNLYLATDVSASNMAYHNPF